MEAKLANMSLKSPGLKSNLPASPTARNFSGSHLNNYLSPDSANNLASPTPNDPAATLAQQRAKLKASNAAHRISAPALASQVGSDGRNVWNNTPNQLAQVDEAGNGAQEITVPSPNANASRPKSTDFSGVANAFKSPRAGGEGAGPDGLSPMVGDSWASMVNTPLIPMFNKERNPGQSLDAAAAKLNDWAGASGPGVPLISDPPKRMNRLSKGSSTLNGEDDNGAGVPQQHNQQQQQQRNVSGGLRNVSGNNAFGGAGGWNGARSPALSQTSSRFNDDGSNGMNGLGMAGFGNGLGMGMPGVPGAAGLNMLAAAGMSPLGVNAFGNMNMFNMQNLAAMGLSAEQILTMQMAAAAGQLGQPGLGAFGLGMQPQQSPGARSGRTSVRSPGVKSPNSTRDGKKDEEDVDPKVLEDVPAWLRSLRLHKYTPNFEGMHWKDMVLMDEAALEAKGVAALGARRKMLKTFEIVRKKMGLDAPAGAVASA